MAALNGLNSGVQFIPGPAGAAATDTGPAAPNSMIPAVIDGTPVRVVVLALSAAAGLTALKLAGFRFNVGVSA